MPERTLVEASQEIGRDKMVMRDDVGGKMGHVAPRECPLPVGAGALDESPGHGPAMTVGGDALCVEFSLYNISPAAPVQVTVLVRAEHCL